MATQRYISTSFWDDQWIQTLDPSEKLLYLYLMTNPLTTISGAYKITIRRMVFDTGFNQDTVSHILAKFEKAKKAYHYHEYIILPSWPKHQKWETKHTIKAGIDADIKTIPKNVQKYMVSIGYQYPILGYGYSPSYLDSDSDSDTEIRNTEEDLSIAETAFVDDTPFTLDDVPTNDNGSHKSKSKPKAKRSPEDTELYHRVQQVFITDYGEFEPGLFAKEGQATWQLISKAKSRDAEHYGDFLMTAIEAFKKLRRSDAFFRSQPMLPSSLNSSGIWPRVLETMRTQELSEEDKRALLAGLNAIGSMKRAAR